MLLSTQPWKRLRGCLLHVDFNGQTEQEVDEAISAFGLESIPFSDTCKNRKNTKLRLLKRQFLMATHLRVSTRLLQLHSLEKKCELLIQVLHYVDQFPDKNKTLNLLYRLI